MSKTTGLIAEFKQFIARGNVMDMAVGVIVGGAFAGGNESLSALAIHLPGGGDLLIGSFLNAVLNFLIMAFVVFCLVKSINKFHRKKEKAAPPPAPPEPSAEERLLTEIRDLLKERG